MKPKKAHKKRKNQHTKCQQHNQLSAINIPIICNQHTNYLQSSLQRLVDGEPAETIPLGQSMTKQKHTKCQQHNQLSAISIPIICNQHTNICNQHTNYLQSAYQYLQSLLQFLVDGEPAETIPPGHSMTKQKQPELCSRG